MSNYPAHSNTDNSHSKDSTISKNERFAKLSEKISQIQVGKINYLKNNDIYFIL